jgi:hypothetical protein
MSQWARNAPNSGRESIRIGPVQRRPTLSQLLRRSQSRRAQWATLKNLARSVTCCLLFVFKGHATPSFACKDTREITRDPQRLAQWLGSTNTVCFGLCRPITATPSFSGLEGGEGALCVGVDPLGVWPLKDARWSPEKQNKKKKKTRYEYQDPVDDDRRHRTSQAQRDLIQTPSPPTSRFYRQRRAITGAVDLASAYTVSA